MFTASLSSTPLSNRFSVLLFRASQLQQLIKHERKHQNVDGLRLMRLNALRLKILNSLYASLQPAQPVLIPVPARCTHKHKG